MARYPKSQLIHFVVVNANHNLDSNKAKLFVRVEVNEGVVSKRVQP